MAGGSVELGHVISLVHPNKSRDIEIFYTTDGTQPTLGSPSTKVDSCLYIFDYLSGIAFSTLVSCGLFQERNCTPTLRISIFLKIPLWIL